MAYLIYLLSNHALKAKSNSLLIAAVVSRYKDKNILQSQLPEITKRMVQAAKHIISTNENIPDMNAFASAIYSGKVQASRWRNGGGNVTLNDVVNASYVFGISLEWLCMGTGDMFLSRLQQMENRISILEKVVKKSVKTNSNTSLRTKSL